MVERPKSSSPTHNVVLYQRNTVVIVLFYTPSIESVWVHIGKGVQPEILKDSWRRAEIINQLCILLISTLETVLVYLHCTYWVYLILLPNLSFVV